MASAAGPRACSPHRPRARPPIRAHRRRRASRASPSGPTRPPSTSRKRRGIGAGEGPRSVARRLRPGARGSPRRPWRPTLRYVAVLLEPPATGTGGRSLSPSATFTSSTRRPEPLAAATMADDGVGAGADLVAGHLHRRLAVRRQRHPRRGGADVGRIAGAWRSPSRSASRRRASSPAGVAAGPAEALGAPGRSTAISERLE